MELKYYTRSVKTRVKSIKSVRVFGNNDRRSTHWNGACDWWLSLLQIISFHPDLSPSCHHPCGFPSFAVDGRSHHLCFLQPGWCQSSSPVLPSDIVLLLDSSNSSGLLGPVRRASLHRAPQVPANGSPARRGHVMVFGQCLTPTAAHFLEGKYIQKAWRFLFLNRSGWKRGAKPPLWKQCHVLMWRWAQVRKKHIHSNVCPEWLMEFQKLAHMPMCTKNVLAYFHTKRSFLSFACPDSHTLVDLICHFNASHSSGLKPFPLCSYQPISFSCQASHRDDTVLGLLSESCLSLRSHTYWQRTRQTHSGFISEPSKAHLLTSTDNHSGLGTEDSLTKQEVKTAKDASTTVCDDLKVPLLK